jgi:hypothetical protein
MKKIKSVGDLPEWFRSAKYQKNLSASEWYREIRKRVWAKEEIEIAAKDPAAPEDRKMSLFRACYKPLKKNWSLFYQYDTFSPLRDMTKREALFLTAYNWDERSSLFFDNALALTERYKDEVESGAEWASPEYEDEVTAFMNEGSDFEADGLDDMVVRVPRDMGNPLLRFGRAFEGYPIIIDTTFDDEAILFCVKDWLSQVRHHDEPKAKRPFTQNDFDDWAFYKIREVHDLDLWASITGTKIPDRVISAALWPHAPDDFSPLDVLRTTSRRKVRGIIRADVHMRLYGQLVLEKGGNFLEE